MPRKKNSESRAYYSLIAGDVAEKLCNGQILMKNDLTQVFEAVDDKANSTSMSKKLGRFFDFLSPVFKRENVENNDFKVVFVDSSISLMDATKAINDALCYRFKIKGAKKDPKQPVKQEVAKKRKKSIVVAHNMKAPTAKLIGRTLNYFIRRKVTAIKSSDYYRIAKEVNLLGYTLSNMRASKISSMVSNVTGLSVKWNYINIPGDGRYLTIDGNQDEIKTIYLKWVEFVKNRFGIDLPVDKNNAIKPTRETPPAVVAAVTTTTTTTEKEISYNNEEKYILWLTAKTLQERGRRGIDADVFLSTLRAKILESRVEKINSRVEYQALLRKEKIFEIGRNGLIYVSNVVRAVQVLRDYHPKNLTSTAIVVNESGATENFLSFWGKNLKASKKPEKRGLTYFKIEFDYTHSSLILYAILSSYLIKDGEIMETPFGWTLDCPAVKFIKDNMDKITMHCDSSIYFGDQYSSAISEWEK